MNSRPFAKLHESVIVGYFCQYVGWIDGFSAAKKEQAGERGLQALNLSHNPLDPAVGDMLLATETVADLPREYYVFEFKRDWRTGIGDEWNKHETRWLKLGKIKKPCRDVAGTIARVVLKEFPHATTAHYYGAVVEDSQRRARRFLGAEPYWDALQRNSPGSSTLFVRDLVRNIRRPSTGYKGFTIEALDKYIRFLNEGAEEGTRAATGSTFLVYAVREYEHYILDEELTYSLLRRWAELRHTPAPTPPRPPSYRP